MPRLETAGVARRRRPRAVTESLGLVGPEGVVRLESGTDRTRDIFDSKGLAFAMNGGLVGRSGAYALDSVFPEADLYIDTAGADALSEAIVQYQDDGVVGLRTNVGLSLYDIDVIYRTVGSPAATPAPSAFPVARTDWSVLTDEATSVYERSQVLREVVRQRDPAAAKIILDILAKQRPRGRWLAELLMSLEWTEFQDAAQRQQAKDLLLSGALALRAEDAPSLAEGTWAALRRYSSLISWSECEVFREFLNESDELKTKQLVLQCIQRVFEASKTAEPLVRGQLRVRVRELAVKFTDPDLLGVRENAALALNAVCALILIGPQDYSSSVFPRVRRSGRSAFSGVVRRSCQRLLSQTAVASKSRPVFDALKKTVEELL
jgi:hypothetical protein